MGSKKARKSARKSAFKKRMFYGNQFTKEETNHRDQETTVTAEERPNDVRPNELPSTSGEESTPKRQKLSTKDAEPDGTNDDENDYFLLVNVGLLLGILVSVSKCPDCFAKIEITNVLSSRMGFANKLKFCCTSCSWVRQWYLSEECASKEGRGRNFYEVNGRMVTAFREIGKGHNSIENFARCMNMHGISKSSYLNLYEDLYDAYENAAEASQKKAASEIRQSEVENIQGKTICQCSLDGSWQKRGHSSLNGVVTAISNGKCIDSRVYSKHCKSCQRWESRKGTPEYESWKVDHDCHINHNKSSGAMEAAGAIDIFCSSADKHNLIFKDYIGDGDTSSFKEVVQAKPYTRYAVTPNKLECIGHVQKRLGNRLRTLRTNYKSSKTPLSGRGKLTDKIVNAMQNYFGLAIRQNQGNLYGMKKAIGAILWHCTDFQDESYRHRYCPTDPDSWCKWRQDQSNGTEKYKKNINLPQWIHDLLVPIFKDLSSDELLEKCLHGKTQNCNEALNNIIWTKCPKNIFVQRNVLEIGVNSATIEFNDGPKGIYEVLSHFNVRPGYYLTRKKSAEKLLKRVKATEKRQSAITKRRRKQLRSIQKGFIDKEKEKEGGDSYVAGGH